MPVYSASSSVALTRTNDANAYGAGDVVGAATGSTAAIEFKNIAPRGAKQIYIVGARFLIEDTALKASEASYTLHLYSITPPSALGDNAAWDLTAGDRAYYLGSIALGTPVDLGSTLYVELTNLTKQITVQPGTSGAGPSVFGYLVTAAGYTPSASRVYNIELQAQARVE